MSPLDCDFIRSRGFTVVEDPEAQNLATPTSLVYAPGCDWNAIGEIFEIAYPAIYIGPELEDVASCLSFEGSDLPKEEQNKVKEKFCLKCERVYRPFVEV